jgi:hypothetical protein
VPRRPKNPKCYGGCDRCGSGPIPLRDLKAALKWTWRHTGKKKHQDRNPSIFGPGKTDARI